MKKTREWKNCIIAVIPAAGNMCTLIRAPKKLKYEM
jgi:hypothetical protein